LTYSTALKRRERIFTLAQADNRFRTAIEVVMNALKRHFEEEMVHLNSKKWI
jgi:hypothetical protein